MKMEYADHLNLTTAPHLRTVAMFLAEWEGLKITYHAETRTPPTADIFTTTKVNDAYIRG